MISKLLIALCLMAVCVAIHATGLMSILRWVRTRPAGKTPTFWPATWVLIRVAAWTTLLHLLQIVMWAIFYAWRGAMPDFTTGSYFSAVTYTTTGYGDLVLPQEWRLVGGVEALTGILMCGLSAGMFFAVFSDIFALSEEQQVKP
jgi:hypothetical protein